MAMTKCKECGQDVSDKAESCPNCGAPIRKRSAQRRQAGCGTFIVVLVILGVIGSVIGNYDNTDNVTSSTSNQSGSSSDSDDESTPSPGGIKRYAHKTINVRSGPGTDTEVVGQLQRGESVRVARGNSEWRRIVRGAHKDAYVYTPILESSPLPTVEITSWNWRSDPNFTSDGAVIWTAELRNNSNSYIEQVRLEFSTYDKDGNIITTDTSYASGLSPGGTASTKGYATYYGREEKGRLRIAGGY